jgi:hypothetical protein
MVREPRSEQEAAKEACRSSLMTEIEKLIDLARDPATFWQSFPPSEMSEQPESPYPVVDHTSPNDHRLALARRLLIERLHLPQPSTF